MKQTTNLSKKLYAVLFVVISLLLFCARRRCFLITLAHEYSLLNDSLNLVNVQNPSAKTTNKLVIVTIIFYSICLKNRKIVSIEKKVNGIRRI